MSLKRDPLLRSLFDDVEPGADDLKSPDRPLLNKCTTNCVYLPHRRDERPPCLNCGWRRDR